MAWQQLSSGVWSNRLHPLAPNWWIGWSLASGFQLLRQIEPLQPSLQQEPLPVYVKWTDSGWCDIYLGEAEKHPAARNSILDASCKLAVHYLGQDLEQIQQLSRPKQIPLALWKKLMTQR
jgi:hypothetical protein